MLYTCLSDKRLMKRALLDAPEVPEEPEERDHLSLLPTDVLQHIVAQCDGDQFTHFTGFLRLSHTSRALRAHFAAVYDDDAMRRLLAPLSGCLAMLRGKGENATLVRLFSLAALNERYARLAAQSLAPDARQSLDECLRCMHRKCRLVGIRLIPIHLSEIKLQALSVRYVARRLVALALAQYMALVAALVALVPYHTLGHISVTRLDAHARYRDAHVYQGPEVTRRDVRSGRCVVEVLYTADDAIDLRHVQRLPVDCLHAGLVNSRLYAIMHLSDREPHGRIAARLDASRCFYAEIGACEDSLWLLDQAGLLDEVSYSSSDEEEENDED